MKTVEQQTAVTAKVQAAFATYPSLGSLPAWVDEAAAALVSVKEPGLEQNYVEALYELFYQNETCELTCRRGEELVGV